MISKKTFTSICTTLAISAASTPAFAHGHGGAEEGPALVYIIGVALNFIIFVGLLVKFGKPALNKKYKQQRDELIQHLDAAKLLREKAKNTLKEYQSRLDGLEEERKEILDRYHKQGEAERDRLIAEATHHIEQLKNNAKNVIRQEQLRAAKELEQEAVERAIKLAEEKLTLRANADTDQKLVLQVSNALKQDAA